MSRDPSDVGRRRVAILIALVVVASSVASDARSSGGGADLEVVSISGPVIGAVGDQLQFTATVRNNGPDPAVNAALLFPAPLSGTVSIIGSTLSTPNTGCFLVLFNPVGFGESCGFGDIAPGTSATETITLEVIRPEPTDLFISASADTTDPSPGNNSASHALFYPAAPPPPPPPPLPPPFPDPRPIVTNLVLPPAILGKPYSSKVAISGGTPPYIVAVNGHPDDILDGFTLSADGVVGGTPIGLGDWTINIKIYDQRYPVGIGPAAIATLTVHVGLPPPLQSVAGALPAGATGTKFSASLLIGGDPPYQVQLTAGRLPRGLTLQPDGTLAGTPRNSGPFAFDLSATDTGGAKVDQGFQLRIAATVGEPVLPNPTLTPGALNPNVTQKTIRPTVCKPGWAKSLQPSPSYLSSMKLKQMKRYELSTQPSVVTEDYFIPLELGGAAHNAANLWPEPTTQARSSNGVEKALEAQVCSGKLSLKVAQRRIAEFKAAQG
jgi:uncharacterized repeat protein (TIGR01451 family)